MQQPIYLPDKLPSNPNDYQKAYDSLQLKPSQGGHPKQDIDGIGILYCSRIIGGSDVYGDSTSTVDFY